MQSGSGCRFASRTVSALEPRRIVSAVSNLCKRIHFGLTNSICRSTKKKNLCKLGTFFSLVHHDELSFYLNSYEKVVLRNLGTCPIPSLQRLSWNVGRNSKRVVSPYIKYQSVCKKNQDIHNTRYSVFKNKKTLWFLDQKSKNRKV